MVLNIIFFSSISNFLKVSKETLKVFAKNYGSNILFFQIFLKR
jgi:hypothetical protein